MAGFNLVPGGTGHNYTGMFTRSIVFSGALLVFLVGTGLTLASIIIPEWISFEDETNHGTTIHYTYGLHQRCSNTNSLSAMGLHCTSYPTLKDCHGDDRYFCSMWRSVGFLMSFAVVIEGMTIAAFMILILGGKQRREQGWGVMALLAVIAALVQACAMALIVRGSCLRHMIFADEFFRRTCTRTMIVSSLAGSSIGVGQCALRVGCFKHYVRPPLPVLRWPCLAKAAMS